MTPTISRLSRRAVFPGATMKIAIGTFADQIRRNVRQLPLCTFPKSKIVNVRAKIMAHHMEMVATMIIVVLKIIMAPEIIDSWGESS